MSFRACIVDYYEFELLYGDIVVLFCFYIRYNYFTSFRACVSSHQDTHTQARHDIEHVNVRGSITLSKKGAVFKSTEFLERLEELDCDPLEYAVGYLKGENANDAHPFLRDIYNFLKEAIRRLNKGILTELEFNQFAAKAEKELRYGYIKPELAIRVALELLKYSYAQRKAIEHTTNPGNTPTKTIPDAYLEEIIRVTTLRREEIKAADKKKKDEELH